MKLHANLLKPNLFKLALATGLSMSIAACGVFKDDLDDSNASKHAGASHAGAQTAGLGSNAPFPGAMAGRVNSETGEKANTIYFGFDKANVEAQYVAILEANARYLESHPNARVRLEGHTDPKGSREYNIGLGQRRGNQVDEQLLMMGVAPEQMVVVSYGKEKPAVPGDSDEARRLDRRVEVIYERVS